MLECCRVDANTVSTSDASGAMRQKTTEPIIISDDVYTGCGAAWQIPGSKPMPRSIYDLLQALATLLIGRTNWFAKVTSRLV